MLLLNVFSVGAKRLAARAFQVKSLSGPIYPSVNVSHSASNGDHGQFIPSHLLDSGNGKMNSASNQQQKQQSETQQIYKTTIPVNNNQCHQCSSEMNQSAVGIQQKMNNDDINGIPSRLSHCCCCPNNKFHHVHVRNSASPSLSAFPPHMTQLDGGLCCPTNTVTEAATGTAHHHHHHRQQQNHTTLVEYELSDGVAKLCKISSNPNIHLPTTFSVVDASRTANSTSSSSSHTNHNVYFDTAQRAYSTYCDKLRGFSSSTAANQNQGAMSEEAKRDRLGLWGTGGDSEANGSLSGLDRLAKKRYNKGLAFSLEERQLLGIQGLLPAVVKSLDEQVEHCMILLDRLDNDLDKYIYLAGLADRNERLFYNVLASNIGKLMPIVYTPIVGLGCQKFSLIFQNPKGLYITIKDKGHVYNVLKNWPEADVRVIVVTDGERILGLGDLGANGMGIPVGKLSLYTALAGVPPQQCLPITLDVGTNTQSILDDPLYIGLRQKRVSGDEYYEFIEEFMQAVVKRFGQNCLIQYEDFGNANAFQLLSKYRDTNCVFNDDIQGTASVALGGLLASLKIKKTNLKENTILFFGAGEAALGIANLCVMAMINEGLTEDEAKLRVWLVDSKGLIVKDRPKGGLSSHKIRFAHEHAPIDSLEEAINVIKPTVLIGAAAIGGAFTPAILEKMAENNENPIIFALSNPTVKAECTAEQAYQYTKGNCIFASGSPFDPVTYNGKTYYPGQGNNSYIFPGVGLGVVCAGMLTIPEEMFLIAAQTLSEICSDEDLEKGSLYPPLSKITQCSVEIAVRIVESAYKKGLATVFPQPKDIAAFVKSQMYDLKYQPAIPEVYQWSNKL